jgi:hypothetical protein
MSRAYIMRKNEINAGRGKKIHNLVGKPPVKRPLGIYTSSVNM